MTRDMLFRALKQLSDPKKFDFMCQILDGERFLMSDEHYISFAKAGLIIQKGWPNDKHYRATVFGRRLVDYILKADDNEMVEPIRFWSTCPRTWEYRFTFSDKRVQGFAPDASAGTESTCHE